MVFFREAYLNVFFFACCNAYKLLFEAWDELT